MADLSYFGKGITVGSGFDLKAALPLDARTVVPVWDAETVNKLEIAFLYKGIQIYCESDLKYRVLVDKNAENAFDCTWKELGSGTGSGSSAVEAGSGITITVGSLIDPEDPEKGNYQKINVQVKESDKYLEIGSDNKLATKGIDEAISTAISTSLSSIYKVKGSKNTIDEVLSISDAKIGDVWNVVNEFTLDGKKYPAGTNVVCKEDTSATTGNDTKWDALGGSVDLSNYATSEQLDNKLDKFSEATADNIIVINSDGKTIADSGIAKSDLITTSNISTNAVISLGGKKGAITFDLSVVSPGKGLVKLEIGEDNILKASTYDYTSDLNTKQDKITGTQNNIIIFGETGVADSSVSINSTSKFNGTASVISTDDKLKEYLDTLNYVTEGGSEGQILTKTSDGYNWQDAPDASFSWETLV